MTNRSVPSWSIYQKEKDSDSNQELIESIPPLVLPHESDQRDLAIIEKEHLLDKDGKRLGNKLRKAKVFTLLGLERYNKQPPEDWEYSGEAANSLKKLVKILSQENANNQLGAA